MADIERYRTRVQEILAVADLEVLSAKRVRRQLEQEFGVDLAAERKQLDAMVMEVLADVTSANAVASADSATSIGADFHIDEGVTDAEDRTSGDRALAAELQRAEQPARPHRHAAAPLGGKLTKRKAAAAALVYDDGKPKKKVASGFTRPLLLSAELSALCGGATELSRGEVVKNVWAYARENNLKDPKDGRFLLPDDLMRIVIPVQRISGFQMSKYLEKHMRPKPVTADELRERERETKEKAERERTRKESKKPPNPNGVFMRPVHVSEELQVVVGEAEVGAALPRPMVIKKIWEYIKSNDLQDPADRRFILCDSLLKPIMGGLDRVSSFKMNTYLAKHLKQKEKVVGGNVAGELVEDSDDDEAAASGNAPAAFAPRGLKSAETVSDGDGDSDE